MKENPLRQLLDYGQSFWMDTISRSMIQDGTLRRMIKDDGLRGVTSNPDIFQKAISGSDLYDSQIHKLALAGKSAVEMYEGLAVDDIRKAADVLKPVYTSSNGVDGYISLEVSPYLAFDTEGTIAEAHRLWEAVARPNVFIKVPATPEGIPAIRQLIADGINVNVTLIFSREAYGEVMVAYISGLEERRKAGKSVRNIASVASFFISRIDVLVDGLLATRPNPKAHALLGQVAIANGKLAYQDYKQVFGGKRWQALKKAGAKVQRPLWASTSSKNPLYDALVYVAPLIGKDTVNTMPMATIDAWRATGVAKPDTVETNISYEKQVLKDLAAVGIDIEKVTWQLVEEGVQKFNAPFDKLLMSISAKRLSHLGFHKQDEVLGKYEKPVTAAMNSMSEGRFGRRLASKDPSLFTEDRSEYKKIANRLGWVDAPVKMLEQVQEIKAVVEAARRDRMKHVVLLGMGGSSLCPEVCANVFGEKSGYPQLVVLDTTAPEAIRAARSSMEINKAVFIVASKSGGTIETMSLYQYFRTELEATGLSNPGSHFIAITDPGTSLQKLAKKEKFRATFINPPDIGGRYSALSLFGLVPMALIGIDIERLLKRAIAFSKDMADLVPAQADASVRLGAILGVLAEQGRDKLTLVASDSLAPMGAWIEQLIAESTGKLGKGILPVDLEQPADLRKYGNDRLFVGIKLDGEEGKDTHLDALQGAGHPVVRITLADVYDLGAEFYRWEAATAIAGALLHINPFDEPNVSEAKANTNALLEEYHKQGEVPKPKSSFTEKDAAVTFGKSVAKQCGRARNLKDAVKCLAGTAEAGDYISLLAFIPQTDANRKMLERAAATLRDRTGCPVTIGFGPRYLHSTGQLHKGGANNGIFVVIVDDPKRDVEIPGVDFSFGTLIRAQGIGDFRTLEHHERRAMLIDLGGGKLGSLV